MPSVFSFLCHLVQLDGEAALLVCGVVLMKNSAADSLVDLLHSELVRSHCSLFIARRQGSVILLDKSLELRLEHLVLQSLVAIYENSLLRGLNVSQL